MQFQSDIPAENKRLKANNVKKVLNGILEYYGDVLAISLGEFPLPDCAKVAEGKETEVGKSINLSNNNNNEKKTAVICST